MSYDIVKTAVGDLIETLGFSPSEDAVDFENASPNEYGNTYILNPTHGENDEDVSETLVDRLHDIQTWSIEIAYARGTHSDIINLDQMNRQRELIIQKLDNPANWIGSMRMLRYSSWDVTSYPNYFVLTINIMITDTITY